VTDVAAGASPRSAPSTMSVLGTLVLVVAGIAVFIAVDTFLAGLDRAARRSEAAQLVREANRLTAEGREREAVERFRTALSLERGNRDYRLALVPALVADGRLREADSTLVGMLHDDATDGEINLALARVLVREGRVPEATSYYHRAIYGRWPNHPEINRTRTRLELVELLARSGAKEDLLAELLPLEAAGLADTALRRRVGHLFVLAGAPARAAAIFRELLRRDGHSADSFAGLAEAEFVQGNYRAAAESFRAATRLQPRNPETTRRLQLVAQVLALDPMQRGLNAVERDQRSAALLQLAVAATERCAGPGLPDTVRAVVDSARAVLSTPVSASHLDEASELKLDLAERVRRLGGSQCRESPTEPERALDLVLERLAD
jgi:tetratricopeptide (TPR) repeat protein